MKMAGKHSARNAARRRRANRTKSYAWLGAGALGLGVGAALSCGAGVASADTVSDSQATSVSASSSPHVRAATSKRPASEAPTHNSVGATSKKSHSRQITPTSSGTDENDPIGAVDESTSPSNPKTPKSAQTRTWRVRSSNPETTKGFGRSRHPAGGLDPSSPPGPEAFAAAVV